MNYEFFMVIILLDIFVVFGIVVIVLKICNYNNFYGEV